MLKLFGHMKLFFFKISWLRFEVTDFWTQSTEHHLVVSAHTFVVLIFLCLSCFFFLFCCLSFWKQSYKNGRTMIFSWPSGSFWGVSFSPPWPFSGPSMSASVSVCRRWLMWLQWQEWFTDQLSHDIPSNPLSNFVLSWQLLLLHICLNHRLMDGSRSD